MNVQIGSNLNRRVALLAILAASTISGKVFAQLDKPVASDYDYENNRVRALYRKGVALYEAGKLQDAYKTLLEAWNARRTYDIASSLAQVEIELRLYADAATHLDFCLQNIPPAENEATLKQFQQAFADTKAHVGQVLVTTNRGGADIYVDGIKTGSSLPSQAIFVLPGQHRIEARIGDNASTSSIIAEAGKTYTAKLDLVGASNGNNATSTTSAPAAPLDQTQGSDFRSTVGDTGASQRSVVPLIIGGTVAVASLGAGIGLRLASNSEENTANTLFAKVGAGGCANASTRSADCAALLNSLKKSDRERNWSTVGFVAGGAAMIATAVYWLWPRASTGNATRAWRVSGNVGSSSSSISVEGSF